jgi:hypothetical protein
MEFQVFASISVPRDGFQVVFFSAEWFRTDSESFLLLTGGTPPEQTNCSVYSVFRRINFLSEISNPTLVLLIPLANNWKKNILPAT